MSESDKKRGFYQKYDVNRSDGSSEPGGKHDGCEYFVLDVTHDPHARAAVLSYAISCRADYPLLADDIEKNVNQGVWKFTKKG